MQSGFSLKIKTREISTTTTETFEFNISSQIIMQFSQDCVKKNVHE